MNDLSWVDEATDRAFALGKQHGKQFPKETPFYLTPLWTKFLEAYQDKLTTPPEQLALKHVAGTAFSLGLRYPKYKGWDYLVADIMPGRPPRQEAYRRLREEAELTLQINPGGVGDAVRLLLYDMWPGGR